MNTTPTGYPPVSGKGQFRVEATIWTTPDIKFLLQTSELEQRKRGVSRSVGREQRRVVPRQRHTLDTTGTFSTYLAPLSAEELPQPFSVIHLKC